MTMNRRLWVAPLLIIILVAALTLRLYNLEWDNLQHVHPDERWIMIVATEIRFPDPVPSDYTPPPHQQTGDWRDELPHWLRPWTSPLNPLYNAPDSAARNDHVIRRFAYGHLPLYLVVGAGSALQEMAPHVRPVLGDSIADWMQRARGYDGYARTGRVLSALFDTLTVFFVFLIGRRIFGVVAGLLGAAFSAFTVTQIQLAHFYAFDPVATTFIMGAVYFSVRLAQDGGKGNAVWAGLMAGCAISSKFSGLPIILAPGLAAIMPVALFILQGKKVGRQSEVAMQPDADHDDEPGASTTDAAAAAQRSQEIIDRVSTTIQLLVIIAGCTFLAFAITSPFAILDWDAYRLAVIEEQGAMVRGDADFPYTRQYRGTQPFLYHIENLVRWGMGWPLGVVAFLGFAWSILRLLAGRASRGEWIILAWVLPYFVVHQLFMVKFMRYMLPVVPLIALLGAGMVLSLWKWGKQRPGQRKLGRDITEGLRKVAQPLAFGLGSIALIGAIFWSLAFVRGVYGTEHTWVQASHWMYENIPDGAVLAVEHWDHSLPLNLPIPGGNAGARGWRHIQLGPYEEDTHSKFETLKQQLREADYIVISSNRLYDSVRRLPLRYPMTIAYYDLLFAGELGFELVAEFTTYPTLFGIEFPTDSADESFTVYDHPKPLIFRKTRDLTDAEWWDKLGGTWETAQHYYTGPGGSPLLALIFGRGHRPLESGIETGPSLLLNQPVDELPVVDNYRWNTFASESIVLAPLVWWLLLLLLGLAAWPYAFLTFRNFKDRGYILSKTLGWLLAGYLLWLLASVRLIPNTVWGAWLTVLLLVLGGAWLGYRHQREIVDFWRRHSRLLLLQEGIFTAGFILFVVIRAFNPDLWQPWTGGEKFMEFAFLNGILRSAYFPPLDPYFAGGYINYYYYGHYLVAYLTKLTGIYAEVAFNLAIPTLFGLTVANAFSLGYNLVEKDESENIQADDTATAEPDALPDTTELSASATIKVAQEPVQRRGLITGLLAAVFVAFIGNLEGAGQLLRRMADLGTVDFQSNLPFLQTGLRAASGAARILMGEASLPRYNYWDPSRVIPYTINEFPYWSFLFADLHPHMIGIPFTIFLIALVMNLVLGFDRTWTGDRVSEGIGTLLLLPLTLGAIAAINTWDLPTYLGLGMLGYMMREYRRSGTIRIGATAVFALVYGGLAYILYAPFFRNYAAVGSSGIGLVRDRTDLSAWFFMWGFFLFIAVSYIIYQLRQPAKQPEANVKSHPLARWLRLTLAYWEKLPRVWVLHREVVHNPSATYVFGRFLLGIGLLLSILLLILGAPVLGVLLLPLAASFVLLLRRSDSPQILTVSMLTFTGLLILSGVEVFFLRDFLSGGEWYRMNTLFKFYIQVWVLLGLAGAAIVIHLWPRQQPQAVRLHSITVLPWSPQWGGLWVTIFSVLLAASLVFTFLGTPSRIDDRFPGWRPPPGTLNGMAFMQEGVYTWPDHNNPIELRYDYEAIRWLLDNVEGTPVVAEAVLGYYREGGLRVSSFTGLPGLLGFHQSEQRYGEQVSRRDGVARDFWNTPDPVRAQQIINQLRISYIYVGQLERTVVSPEGLAKFERMREQGLLRVVFKNPGVTIYQVVSAEG